MSCGAGHAAQPVTLSGDDMYALNCLSIQAPSICSTVGLNWWPIPQCNDIRQYLMQDSGVGCLVNSANTSLATVTSM